MRRLIVAAALLATTSAGWLTTVGATPASEPTADDWNVRRTYVSAMYVDPLAADDVAYASAGACTVAATDDSCA